jgi:hypothetical protein
LLYTALYNIQRGTVYMAKIRVNWTLNRETMKILASFKKEAEKRHNRKISQSELIDEIVGSIKSPLERKKEEARDLAIRLSELQSSIRELEKGD